MCYVYHVFNVYHEKCGETTSNGTAGIDRVVEFGHEERVLVDDVLILGMNGRASSGYPLTARGLGCGLACFLRALFGLPLDSDQFEVYQRHTGRTPSGPFREAWVIAGRRAGERFRLAGLLGFAFDEVLGSAFFLAST